MNFSSLQPVFVCGHYRSGTSLLHHLLDGHSKIGSCAIETKLFVQYIPDLKDGVDEKVALNTSLLRMFESEELTNKYYPSVNIKEFKARFDELQNGSYTDFKKVMDGYVQTDLEFTGQYNSNLVYWLEKTPLSELFTDDILEFWPNARFIHVVRDPRSVHASVRRRSDFPLEPRTTFHNWSRSLDALSRNQGFMGPDQLIVVKYEDMVLNLEREMNRICAFLGVNVEESTLVPTKVGGKVEWRGNSIGEGYKGVQADSLESWKQFQPISEIKLLEEMSAKRLAKFGYELNFQPSIQMKTKSVIQKSILKIKELRQIIRGNHRGAY